MHASHANEPPSPTARAAPPAETAHLHLLLRLGIAACFIGHGAFGLLQKEEWVPFFGLAGIGADTAFRLMPLIGTVDIAVGLLALFRPFRALLVWAVAWCVWTAALRPLTGLGVWELLERAGNYGVPLALLVLVGTGRGLRDAFTRLDPRPVGDIALGRCFLVLQWTTALLLIGHGALALAGKPLLATHLEAVGLPPSALPLAGGIELALAAWILWRPGVPAFLFAALWKFGTEALYVAAASPVWEVVERGGSYVAPIAAAMVLQAPGWERRASRAGGAVAARAGTIAALLLAAALSAATAVAAADGPSAWSPTASAAGEGASIAPSRSAVGAGEGASTVPPRSVLRAGEALADPTLVERLLEGGWVLACRHAITDRSRGDARRVDFDDPGTQRVLSAEGERQARALGGEVRRLGIPVDEVLASPYQRTKLSAELMFGRATVEHRLSYQGWDPDATVELFARPPAAGGNRVLMTHQGTLYRVLPVRRGSVAEGACLLVRPGERPEMLGVIEPEDWARAGREAASSREPASDDRAERAEGAREARPVRRRAPAAPPQAATDDPIDAVRAGGVTLVCRHAITDAFGEREPVDYEDPSTQRRLSPEGERQSEAMGRAMLALGVDVQELVASPMDRAIRTAALMFGRDPAIDPVWHTNGDEYDGPARDRRLERLADPIPGGGVRLIVSHIGTMTSVLPRARGIDEGDCVVVRPAAGGFEHVGVVPWRAWERALARRPGDAASGRAVRSATAPAAWRPMSP